MAATAERFDRCRSAEQCGLGVETRKSAVSRALTRAVRTAADRVT